MKNIITFILSMAFFAPIAIASVPHARHIESMAKEPAIEDGVIYEAMGEPTYYRRNSLGWYIYAGGNNLQYGPIPGTSKIIRSIEEENVAYIYNPLTADARNSYIKCTIEGDKLRAQFPQMLALLEDVSGVIPLYIGKLVPFSDENGESYMPIDNQEENYYTWTIQPDGSITLDHDPIALTENGSFIDGMPNDILGTYYYQTGIDGQPEAFWNGVGDWAQTYTEVVVEPVTSMPANIPVEAWQMTSKKTTRMVDVAIDGDVLYMSRLTQYGDGALVGNIVDDKVVFPSYQNLGFSFVTNANVYFIGTKAVYGSYDFGDYVMTFLSHFEMKDELVFSYDPLLKTLTPTMENTCILVNAFKDQVSHYEYIENPSFKYLLPEGMNANPLDPEIIVPGRYDGFDDGYYFEFILPTENVDGVTLNTDRMYYNIYLNDELTTFYTDQYRYLSEDVTDIPYSLTDFNHDFAVEGTKHMLQFHSEGISTIGVQSCFIGDNGIVYKSNLITGKTSTGLDDISVYSEIASEHFYDLQGREVENIDNASGIFVKRTVYTDGSVLNSKIVK